MNASRKLASLFLVAILCSCATGPAPRNIPFDDMGEANIEALRDLLPGKYSNFAQAHDQGTGSPVTDINIRQLKTGADLVFLYESELRDLDSSSQEIYWLKPNRQTGQAELYFTALREDELSLPLQEILSIAWQRVEPGCVIRMSRDGDQFNGQTHPDTCRFKHPLQGETRLSRNLSIDRDALIIKTELKSAIGSQTSDEALLELQKHRMFIAWTSIRPEASQQQDQPAMWPLSQVFSIRDDGRLNQLYDQQMRSMGFGLQLARLHRLEGEKPYYQLSVINLESGQIQAYQWFKPDTERLNLNLDWFQTNLELHKPSDPQP
ncbi:MAG: CpcT/CpeT family chromophore lyase [Xanthomonadales bacterium]|nr:CpcT/CpeT family chromophore lyase [Xanthomonadales bacterium]